MFKKLILLFTILFSLSFAHAQEQEIESTFKEYIKATHAANVDEQLDYFHPSIFDFFPRENMLDGLKKSRENGKVSLSNERLSSTSEVYKEDGQRFALLTYLVDLSLNVSELKGQEGGKEAIAKMKADYVNEYGEEYVSFNSKTYVFTITFTNKLYAIFDKRIGNWKFIPKDKYSTVVINQVIPERIRARLN